MTRWWNELAAVLDEITPGGLVGLAFILFLLASVIALLWYNWPLHLPSRRRSRSSSAKRRRLRLRRFRLGRLRWRWPSWRWRRRHRREASTVDELGPDELPDLPAEVLAQSADQLAAAGRFAEAVRERLRAIVRELIEREVIEHRPGWTVTELANAASQARPEAAAPLRSAVETFSLIWYAQSPATAADDERLRGYAAAVHDALLVAQP
jgi:hypothetical protein